ncbi:MAG: hypothetical protein C5B50_26465 [Verrucomicrobia bacterium]|nr:MAG: hypothetical protein C5B50_26465 [Verrucomicrobiota bacterium]
MQIERFNRVLQEIEDVISKRRGRLSDKEAKLKISSLAGELVSLYDFHPHVIGEASNIKRWADVLYTAKKPLKSKSKSEPGVAVAKRAIRSAIHDLSRWPKMDAYLRGIQKKG